MDIKEAAEEKMKEAKKLISNIEKQAIEEKGVLKEKVHEATHKKE